MVALKQSPVPLEPSQPASLATRGPASTENPFDRQGRQTANQSTSYRGKITRILVPTDFSSGSTAAIHRAAELALHHDATLTLIHVIDINAPACWKHIGTAESLMQELWTEGLNQLGQLAEALKRNRIRTETRILEGLPPETIVESSAGFDLLVIGGGRRKSAWSLFSRHTAQRVVKGARCPVEVVHEHADLATRVLEPKTKLRI